MDLVIATTNSGKFLEIQILGQTMAELPLEKKNLLSHRGKALQKLKEFL